MNGDLEPPAWRTCRDCAATSFRCWRHASWTVGIPAIVIPVEVIVIPAITIPPTYLPSLSPFDT